MSQPMIQPNITNTDSLQVLLKKTKAICTVNGESLDLIKSRRGQEVISRRKYVLEERKESPQQKKRKLGESCEDGNASSLENDIAFVSHDTKKDVNTIIDNWKYMGDVLKKEHVAIIDFIDRSLSNFKDLLYLQKEYKKLIEAYSRILVDQPESRVAVNVVLENVELLQVAIGNIHEQIIDERNDVEDDSEVQESVNLVRKGIQKIREKGIKFSIELSGVTEGTEKDSLIRAGSVEFNDVTNVKCMHTYLGLGHTIHAVEPFAVDGVDFIAVNDDCDVKLWKIGEDDDPVSLVTENDNGSIFSLASYHKNDKAFLACGCEDGAILIWNITNKRLFLTLSGHINSVNALQLYEKRGEKYLISGCTDGKLVIWDLVTYDAVKTVECGIEEINALAIFSKDGTDHVIVGARRGIGIWRLDQQYAKVAELDTDGSSSLAVTTYKGSLMLAGGTDEGEVKVWNLEDYQLIETYDIGISEPILGLSWIVSNERNFLISGGEDDCNFMRIWDTEFHEELRGIEINSDIYSLTVMERDGHNCILTGHYNGEINVWEESFE